jgi:hypothetical protein
LFGLPGDPGQESGQKNNDYGEQGDDPASPAPSAFCDFSNLATSRPLFRGTLYR